MSNILGKSRSQVHINHVHTHFGERQSDHHIFPYHDEQWQLVSGDIAHYCERQFHYIFSYCQQQVSDIAHSSPAFSDSQMFDIYYYILFISESEHVAISFPCLPFT